MYTSYSETMKSLILYSYFRSSAAFRVRIALHLKNLDFEYRPVHLLNNGGEHHSAGYRQINPLEEVPTLIHEGFAIGQSMAILNYLDDLKPEPRLFPLDPKMRAQVIQLCEAVNSSIHPIQNLKVQQELEKRFQADAQAKEDWARHWIRQGFEGIEKIVAKHSGSFAMGPDLTAADLYLIPQVFNAERYKLEMSAFPKIKTIYLNCMKLKPFVDADPFHQIDTPK